MFHKAVIGRSSRNLDGFMLDPDAILMSFARGCIGMDVAVVEGVMGLFDSHDGVDEKGSTAQVGKILRAPVILIVDVKKTARSAAALIHGFQTFDPDLKVAGVVLNRVGSPRHKEKVQAAVEKLAGIEVLGALPSSSSLHMPERHLGLVPVHELEKDVNALSNFVCDHVDFNRVIEIARSAEALRIPKPIERDEKFTDRRVGIAYDAAFRFYYPETLRQISEIATPVFIDALNDKKLPSVDVLYIGGGFPEVFAKQLERNSLLRNDIHTFCSAGKRVYAECGGLMYLGETISTSEGEFEMVGFLPLKTEMQERYVGMGYVINEALRNNPLCRMGEVIIGHEFHHSRVKLNGSVEFAYKTCRGYGIDGKHDGIIKNDVLASYMHVHPLGYKGMVSNLFSKKPVI
jgi:cobyrinic acid a,c-diamide synthase